MSAPGVSWTDSSRFVSYQENEFAGSTELHLLLGEPTLFDCSLQRWRRDGGDKSAIVKIPAISQVGNKNVTTFKAWHKDTSMTSTFNLAVNMLLIS